jgi:hypothetical protein
MSYGDSKGPVFGLNEKATKFFEMTRENKVSGNPTPNF